MDLGLRKFGVLVGAIYGRSWAVTDDSPETGTKTVVVTVSWTEKGVAEDVTLTTIVRE